MKAEKIWGSGINAQLGVNNYVVRIHGENDYGNVGVFAVEVLNFSIFRSKTMKTYSIEVYKLDSDGYPELVHYVRCQNKSDLKKQFKTFQY